jgi:hypothetical protein
MFILYNTTTILMLSVSSVGSLMGEIVDRVRNHNGPSSYLLCSVLLFDLNGGILLTPALTQSNH